MTHDELNVTHDAETAADEGPRWSNFSASFAGDPVFLGRAGPIDIWLDTGDTRRDGAVPFLAKSETHQRWASSTERVIEVCELERIHLTLHDQCLIHSLCAPHNLTNLTTTETDND